MALRDIRKANLLVATAMTALAIGVYIGDQGNPFWIFDELIAIMNLAMVVHQLLS